MVLRELVTVGKTTTDVILSTADTDINGAFRVPVSVKPPAKGTASLVVELDSASLAVNVEIQPGKTFRLDGAPIPVTAAAIKADAATNYNRVFSVFNALTQGAAYGANLNGGTPQFLGTVDWSEGTTESFVTVKNAGFLGPTYYALLGTHAYKSNGPQATGSTYTIKFAVYLATEPDNRISATTRATLPNNG